MLVHNRKDMPGLPLAAEGDGVPSNPRCGQARLPRKAGQGRGEGARKPAGRAKARRRRAAKKGGREAPSPKTAPRSVQGGVGRSGRPGPRPSARDQASRSAAK